MKRADITPRGVYSLVGYRDDRQGRPVMILSTDSYAMDWRTRTLNHAGNARLVQGDHIRRGAVGLLSVHLMFDMHSGQGEDGNEPPMDVLDYRAKVEVLAGLVSVPAAIAALNASGDKAWDDREHLYIRDAEGTLLGRYELLTGLQMVRGDYVTLTLAERRARAERARWADEAEQARVANVERFNRIAADLDKLGITGYHAAAYESVSRFTSMNFDDMEALVALAEQGALRQQFR